MAYGVGSGGVSVKDATNYAKRKRRKPAKKRCPHGVGPNGKCLPRMGLGGSQEG